MVSLFIRIYAVLTVACSVKDRALKKWAVFGHKPEVYATKEQHT